MADEETKEHARHLIKKAKENFEAADLLAKGKHFNAAASRLYYASFQIVYQKMIRDIPALKSMKIHKQALDYLGKNNPDNYGVFSELIGLRVNADYDNIIIDEGFYERYKAKGHTLFFNLEHVFNDLK